ncbi:FKBP12-rapamycin complex-associated protein [Cladophialophora psammophila CBS 110553]|uniref:Serine/threonine-protein kinase TOR n=1 Tax=Cladophialophora psammophila CBS 110553 TaxID=1182543 RepID=W9WLH3_9EURO|nr:FKBP12-rapamycin complex-associated protein [Cladophialophora psammophila CBS 110553]EXJ69012.1 FKBP12-rapamycin complex-associated protein [Cladophialophora psammophila CBS 110553]
MASSQGPGPDPSERIFVDLRSKNDEVKNKAAAELRDLITLLSREWSPERFSAFYDRVTTRISNLIVQAPDPSDKVGGVLALDRLIDCEAIDPAQKASKYSNYLRAALKSNDYTVLDAASRALGHLARPGGAYTAELVEAEMTSAFEWLQPESKQESRKLAAVLLIRELAKNSPTLVYGFIPQIFELIWNALRDPKDLIRRIAAQSVSACFGVMVARDTQFQNHWFAKIYSKTLEGFRPNTSVDETLGSLLILNELLQQGNMFMHDFYRNACEIVLRLKDHRDPRIRTQIVQIIPVLAEYAPLEFINNYLHKFMIYLQAQLKREKERNQAFIAIGQIADAVGSAIAQYLDGIILYIRESLSAKTKNRAAVDEGPMFKCISMLAGAVGQTLSKYMEALLDPIFACGLTEPMEQALEDMAHHIPPIRATIQDKLLDLLSLILVRTPYRPLGCPPNTSPPLPSFAKDYGGMPAEHKDYEITLALKTLGKFDFSGHILNEFVRDVTLRYATNDNPEIRRAAALTCCQLFMQDPILHQTSNNAIQVVGEVVDKLLTVAVGDPDADIRVTVLRALDRKFDKHLARPENIRCLFLAVNDEVFAVREAAIEIIGRLTTVNPAYVFPPLRKLLVNLLTGLGYSNTAKQKEESARLISLFVSNATSLVRTYVEAMVSALLPKATDPNPGVASTTIKALGDLTSVGGDEMAHHIPELMPIIIDALQDLGSHEKREAAMKTLRSLAINSQYVIDPYLDYPELLGILINIIKTEAHEELRTDAIKLVGVLGALDPYKYQQLSESVAEKQSKTETQPVSDVALIMQGLTPSNEEFYPTVVINTLMQTILADHTLVQYHSAVIDAVVTIFKTIGMKCVPFLGQIIPGFLGVIRSSPPPRLESYFNQLAVLVNIVRQHIRAFLPEIIEVIREFWNISRQVQSTILSLIEAISKSLEGEFRRYLAGLLPLMLGVIENDTDLRRESSIRILHTFLVFGASGEEYMHMIVPAIVGIFENPAAPPNARKAAIDTLGKLSRTVNVTDFASLMIHPLAKILSSPEKVVTNSSERSLKSAALDCICALIYHLGQDFVHYLPLIERSTKAGQINSERFQKLIENFKSGKALPVDFYPEEQYGATAEDTTYSNITSMRLPVNQQHLKSAWDTSQKSTKEDWQEWMRRFSVELLKESPSHALRACASLAGVYQPLAKYLFNSAFVSCWTELYDQYQEQLIQSFEKALISPNIPPDILQTLLNLAEFMEHDDKSLAIDLRTLGRYAAKCHAFAKALHYKELEFEQDQNSQSVEALISINNQLQQSDAAIGILRRAQVFGEVELKEAWFEKLQRWEEALAAYQKREKIEPDNFDVIMGKMRCLHALGEWKMLSEIAQEHWNSASTENRKNMSALAAAAAWGRGEWDLMDNYISVMKESSPDRAFFGAILAIQRNNFVEARNFIIRAQDGVNSEIAATIGESYNRAYSVVVRAQMLAELEEIILFKQSEGNIEKQNAMKVLWNKRLLGCQSNVEVWQRMLKVRALVLTPSENPDIWIKFANLCRKSERIGLAERSLASLGGSGNLAATGPGAAPPPVAYARLKFTWATGNQQQALTYLRDFTTRLADEYQQANTALASGAHNDRINNMNGLDMNGHETIAQRRRNEDLEKYAKLLAKCYLRQGEWQSYLLRGDWTSPRAQEPVRDILNSYQLATEYNESWYKAWHAYALANFEVVTSMASHTDQDKVRNLPEHVIQNHVVPAIRGFFRSIALSRTSSLQDTLRLLTLWFAHGGHSEVNQVVIEGFASVSIDTWLEVIPQLIARINQPNARVRAAVHRLLAEVGKAHPQALVYPLTVAMKSSVARRANSATQIMDSMRTHSPRLVEQADLVSHELIRVAVLWHELWHEGLEEASRLYFGDHDVEGMLATLAPLHELLDRGAETLREVSFAQAFGHDLAEARAFCNAFRRSKEIGDLNQAWDLYYAVFRKIARQLPQLMSLDLKYVSPRLKDAHDLDLAVPGTYQSGKPIIRIVSFDHVLTVIPSKQRPRKMTLKGSDGVSYAFLLKGHEDIRQDERVMQLFGLVNTLLNNDTESFKRHLNIQHFPAIPLSQNSGLLGWVPNSDTLHNLVKEYRESRRILLNIEHRIMLQMAPDYDNLTLMQKVEVFGYAMDNTTGKDLYRVLWLKSKSSEAWLDRRTNYTRSLAVMSMVGYILGLGDRHPSNLMLDRITGKIIHIDFGDCFEVAMHREKYPERVPFRLTRMLTFAMEVSNIEGSFRITCENVMRVIRENKESILAVLEAFIHDPLLNWRLNTRESPPRPHFRSERRQSIIDAPGAQGGDYDRSPMESANNPAAMMNAQGQSHVGAPPGRRHRRSSVLDPAMVGGSVLDKAMDNNAAAQEAKEVQNARALQVLARVKEKLTGRDFKPAAPGTASYAVATALRADVNGLGLESLMNVNGGAMNNLTNGTIGAIDMQAHGTQVSIAGTAPETTMAGIGGLGVAEQVDRLILQATNVENLCQHYIGWCSFW